MSVCCTGEGGNNLLGNKKQINNQDLQRGNAALVSLSRSLLKHHSCEIDPDGPMTVHSADEVSVFY